MSEKKRKAAVEAYRRARDKERREKEHRDACVAAFAGIEPSEGLVRELVEALEEIERDVRGPADHCDDLMAKPACQLIQETARKALAKCGRKL